MSGPADTASESESELAYLTLAGELGQPYGEPMVLLASPTDIRVATMERAAAEQPDADVVLVGTNTDAPRVVLIQTWTEEPDGTRAVIDAVGPALAFIVLAPPNFEDKGDFPRSIDEWVALCVARLEAVMTDDVPVRLVGWSFGGVVAAHLAMWCQKHRPEWLAADSPVLMIDSRNPATKSQAEPVRSVHHSVVHHLDELWALPKELRRAYLMVRCGRILDRRRRTKRSTPDPDSAESTNPPLLTPLRKAIYVAWLKYEPQPMPVDAVLLWCDDSCDDLGEVTLGWGPLWTGPLRLRRVGAKHFTVFREPALTSVAEAMVEFLG